MKIGLFVDAFFPMIDGVINVVDCYAKELSKFADVTVFCPITNGYSCKDKPYKIVGCLALSIPNFDYPIPTPSFDRKFMRILKKSRLDVVHAHSPFALCHKAKKYAKKKKVPFIGTIHSQYKIDFENFLKLRFPTNLAMSSVLTFYNSCKECWTVNEGMRVLYQNSLGLTAPCKVIQNATDHLPIKDKLLANMQINDLYALKDKTLVLLFVGRITYKKNVQLIADALAILKKNSVDFKMLFVGTGQDEEKLSEKINRLNLQKEVLLLGRITDKSLLEKLYLRAKLLLFPSLYDASSLVQIESACQRTPTLFAQGAITSCGISKDENGFLAEATPQSYASEIVRIVNDDKLYERVSEGCFRDLYITWEQVAKTVYKEYEELIKANATKKPFPKRIKLQS